MKYKLVPEEPTEEMLDVGNNTRDLEWSKGQSGEVIWQRTWKAMLAAAPSPPAKDGMSERDEMITLNEIADAVHKLAWEKGWHNDNETEDHFVERACNNLHDEISELHEAWRGNALHAHCDKAEKMLALGIEPLTCAEEEYADIQIRTCAGYTCLSFKTIPRPTT